MIRIVKASAGSGKTFRLARTYIRLLFSKRDRHAYRHILAVTFTNKATDEMKSRILQELFTLASDPASSPYCNDLVPSLFAGLPELGKEAEIMLSNILHDYGAFAISTIDRFFQQTLKAFSREIGQFASYQVELDKKSLVTESVDRILDSLTEDSSDLLKWLTDSALEQIEKGGRYTLEYGLAAMAERLKSDELREVIDEAREKRQDGEDVPDEEKFFSKDNLKEIRTECRKIIGDFEDEVRRLADNVLSAMSGAGVEPGDFYRGFMKTVLAYAGEGGETEKPSESFLARAADPESWFSAAKKKLLAGTEPLLAGPLNEFVALYGTEYRVYRTARIIDEQLYALGVAGEIDREFKALMKEKNVLSIDDSNTILKNIIDGTDTPFIYEKTGVRFDSFLLDEFQDTAGIQWGNFFPLLRESAARGEESLIVGDVKQSIYRWRGSDWNLLDNGIKADFDNWNMDFTEETLDTNYRSFRNVVEFNNMFFRYIPALLDNMLGGENTVEGIYSGQDVVQKVNKKEAGGVRLTFCNKEDELDRIVETINDLVGRKARYGDIAVLVRNNSSGAEVARRLIAAKIPVITDDSLKVKSSVTVRRLVSLLSWAENPEDRINCFLAGSLGISVPEDYLSLTDLCEGLIRRLRLDDAGQVDGETLYIQSFMDAVSDYSSVYGNDLRGFLKHWAEADPVISSPSSGNSVRIITVHKSKGLAFQYVIFPFVETVTLFRAGSYWCRPDLGDTELSEVADGFYDVRLSSKSEDTLFSKDYRKELKMQYVDNLNIMYVAMTRAVRGMHIIASMPPEKFLASVEDGSPAKFSDFSQALYAFAAHLRRERFGFSPEKAEGSRTGFAESVSEDGSVSYSYGEVGEFVHDASHDVIQKPVGGGYPSFALNPSGGGEDVPVCERGRLKFSADALDFFDGDGHAGAEASRRLRGIVLHDILAGVRTPDDLRGAVDAATGVGDVSVEEAESAFSLLSGRIASARMRGWFPDDASRVRNEVTLIDTDGRLYRPDRIVRTDDGLIIIDYKFGEHRPSYLRQIGRYADICRRMGHRNVSAYLWYVQDDKVVS